jgi:hypothetical protein
MRTGNRLSMMKTPVWFGDGAEGGIDHATIEEMRVWMWSDSTA